MKLIGCYVENFGCLHQFDYQFQEGLTTINEMNGWGKSTFAVFIRSMFYGLPKSTKRNLNENERAKYTPWNGGKMGGNLVFEVNGKIYKLERFFEKMEKDDTFVLYDKQTNLLSSDYSSNIGEELFGIDLDAYAKSAYISQDIIEIGTNDSMNAKLGNLLDSDNDINNFDIAIKNLKEAKKKYKMAGRKGTIPEAEQEISKKKIQLEKKESIREALFERMKQRKQIQEEKETIQKELEKVKEEVGKAAKYEANVQKKKHYEEVVTELTEKKEMLRKARLFFKNGVPSEKAIIGCKQAITNLEQRKGEQKSYILTEKEIELIKFYEEKIAEGVFSNETLDSMETRSRDYSEYKIKIENGKLSKEEEEKLAEGEEFFQKGIPTEEELRMYMAHISEIDKQEAEIEIAKKQFAEDINAINIDKKEQKDVPIILFFAFICLLAGIALFIFSDAKYAFLAVGIGFILLGTYSLLLGKKKKIRKEEEIQIAKAEDKRRKEIETKIEKKEELKNKMEAFLLKFFSESNWVSYMEPLMQIRDKKANYIALTEKIKKGNIEDLEEKQEASKRSLTLFLKIMREEAFAENEEWEKGLQNIRKTYNQFIVLRKQRERALENGMKIKDFEERIQKFLEGFEGNREEDYTTFLDQIKSKMEEWNRWNVDEIKLEEIKNKMEETSDFKDWVNLEEQELAIGLLREKEAELEEMREGKKELEKQIQDKINELLALSDELYEIEQEKMILEEKVAKDRSKLEIIEATIKYLEEAKELFSSHYLKGLRESFHKYVERIGDINILGAKIDAKMEVSVDKNGTTRKIDYFSRGNKDLINVCARFALVDALFEEEKPVLILDDTFVNFDGKKLKNVLLLLEEISKTYQVIYLVCHESRVSN